MKKKIDGKTMIMRVDDPLNFHLPPPPPLTAEQLEGIQYHNLTENDVRLPGFNMDWTLSYFINSISYVTKDSRPLTIQEANSLAASHRSTPPANTDPDPFAMRVTLTAEQKRTASHGVHTLVGAAILEMSGMSPENAYNKVKGLSPSGVETELGKLPMESKVSTTTKRAITDIASSGGTLSDATVAGYRSRTQEASASKTK